MCYKSTKDASSASSIQILHKAFAKVQWTLCSTLLVNTTALHNAKPQKGRKHFY